MTLRNRIRMRLVYFHKRDRTCLSFVESFQLDSSKSNDSGEIWCVYAVFYASSVAFSVALHCIAFRFVSLQFYFIPCQFSWLLHSKIVIRSTSYLALNKFVVARLNETWIAKLNCASEPNATRKKHCLNARIERQRKKAETNKWKKNASAHRIKQNTTKQSDAICENAQLEMKDIMLLRVLLKILRCEN